MLKKGEIFWEVGKQLCKSTWDRGEFVKSPMFPITDTCSLEIYFYPGGLGDYENPLFKRVRNNTDEYMRIKGEIQLCHGITIAKWYRLDDIFQKGENCCTFSLQDIPSHAKFKIFHSLPDLCYRLIYTIFGPEPEANPDTVPQHEDKPNYVPQPEDQLDSVPLLEENTGLVPQLESKTDFLPHPEDEHNYVQQLEDKKDSVPQPEDVLDYVPLPNAKTVSLTQPEDKLDSVPPPDAKTGSLPQPGGKPDSVPQPEVKSGNVPQPEDKTDYVPQPDDKHDSGLQPEDKTDSVPQPDSMIQHDVFPADDTKLNDSAVNQTNSNPGADCVLQTEYVSPPIVA